MARRIHYQLGKNKRKNKKMFRAYEKHIIGALFSDGGFTRANLSDLVMARMFIKGLGRVGKKSWRGKS